MATKTAIRVDWRAAGDGEGHAIAKRATRTLCNRVPVLERLAWPERSRCAACGAELARLEALPMPQR